MWKESMAQLRGLVEPGGRRSHRAGQIVEKLRDFPSLISELKNLVEPCGETAHRTAELLQSLLQMPDWLDAEKKGLRDDAEAELDRLCRMIALTLDELSAMIKFFPNLASWQKADLVKLRDDAVDMQREEDQKRRLARAALRPAPAPIPLAARQQAGPSQPTPPVERRGVQDSSQLVPAGLLLPDQPQAAPPPALPPIATPLPPFLSRKTAPVSNGNSQHSPPPAASTIEQSELVRLRRIVASAQKEAARHGGKSWQKIQNILGVRPTINRLART